MDNLGEIGTFYREYGESSFAEDEPLYATICSGIADRPEMLQLLAGHLEEARQPNLILAAAHYLLLSGLEHQLADMYAGRNDGDVAAAFADLVLSNREQIDEILTTRRTQTNEVGRSAVLAVMLRHVGASADQPLAWIDLGTSGGLNLLLDRFLINYTLDSGMASTGPSDSRVVIDSNIRAGRPDLTPSLEIAWRVGVDRAPVQVTDPSQARWLQACLWPSKVERAHRLAAAIDIAQISPPRIINADAVDGLEQALALAPAEHTIVMTTTWVWFYLPENTRQRVLAILRACEQRVHWYSCEGAGVVVELNEPTGRQYTESSIGLLQIGGGEPERAQLLGRSHPHGSWFTWTA